jgi:AcrR family transcriptional regulator
MARAGKNAEKTSPVGSWGEREAGILDVARDLFLRDGYENTSMAAVAAAAGLSEGTLYNYFRNKTDLVIRVTLVNLELRVAAAMRAVDVAATLREGLEKLIALHLSSIIGDEEIYRTWLREVRGVKTYRRSASRDALGRFANQFPRLLLKFGHTEKAGAPSHAMMRDLVFGGSEHIGFTAIVQRRADRINVEATAKQLADVYLRGFALE